LARLKGRNARGEERRAHRGEKMGGGKESSVEVKGGIRRLNLQRSETR
jgi:hypothetical protein